MAINLIKTSEIDKIVTRIEGDVSKLASSNKVLFLIAGGSAIGLAVKLRLALDDVASNISFTLTDERYGPAGHVDSNWKQLLSEGFKLAGTEYYEVLQDKTAQQTIAAFNDFLKVNDAKYKIGLFGMGADGHTSGILPGSPAVDAKDFVAYYEAPDFKRITTTPAFIETLDFAYLYAMGENKHQQIERLGESHEISEQPAQVLKRVKNLIVFNDYKGEQL
jgi:6-phosphogluconolactonase/glucosamine-6-phosphate isomerase/deaminase